MQVSIACWGYDPTRALMTGAVKPDGLELIYHDLRVEETSFRQLRHREFDIAELSLSSYITTQFWDGGSPFVAIPVFPSRYFRHGGSWPMRACWAAARLPKADP